MPMIKSSIRHFAVLFLSQFLVYGIITWTCRSIAYGYVGQVFTSDLACGAITFTVIKNISKSESSTDIIGYVLGGACGSVVSMWITSWLGFGVIR